MVFTNIILAKLSESFFFFESKYEILYSFRNHLNEFNNIKTQKDLYNTSPENYFDKYFRFLDLK